MKIEGNWKAVGPAASSIKDLVISDGIIEVSVPGGEDKKDKYILSECTKYGDIVEEAKYVSLLENPENKDMIIHVEEQEGHLISILSVMTMEYDGRGLIVFYEYVHEDDYQYVDEDFASKLYHYCNDREAVPMPKMDMQGQSGAGMMGMMGMQGAGQMSLMGTMGMQSVAQIFPMGMNKIQE